MIAAYRRLLSLLTPRLRFEFWAVLVVLTLSAVFDLVGIVMIVPFLTVMADPGVIESTPWLARAYEVSGAETTFGFLQMLGIATFVLVLLGIVLRAGAFYLASVYARRVNLHFGMRRFAAHLGQPYEWFLTRHPSEVGKSVLQEVNEVVTGTVVTCLRIVPTLSQIAVMAVFLLSVEPLATLVIGAAFGASFLVVDLVVRRRLVEMGRKRMRANGARHRIVGEAVRGIRETKMMGLEPGYARRFEGPSRRLARYQTAVLLIGEMPRYALELVTFGGMLSFSLWLLWARQGGIAEVVPLLGAFAFAAIKVMPALQLLFRDVGAIRYSSVSLRALQEDIAAPVAPAAPARPLPLGSGIALEGVGYTYPGSDRGKAVTDLTLEIPAGRVVGVMGATGSGKSTLVDLIMGLVVPTEGRVAVGGVALDAQNRRAWRRAVGFVPQVINLIDAGIAENVARTAPPGGIDMDRVRRAAEAACIAEFVATLPQGYETRIGDAGVKLSGGQRQRVGIARALYEDHAVLVFDEATSALDAVTERAVIASIRALAGPRTLILVSHRLSTLAGCDEILMMKDGRIADTGSFEVLRARSPDMRSMLQAASSRTRPTSPC
jgi:ABC-type multidrug transport system fused ATPase/permease subunit